MPGRPNKSTPIFYLEDKISPVSLFFYGFEERAAYMSSIVKLNVLTRLIIGFSALFIITTSVSFYSILKLKQFNGTSVHMLETGDKLLQYKDRLSDALLSQVSYEKKFVIAKDNLYYDRFLEAGKQFARCLREAAGVAGALGGKEILDSIGKTTCPLCCPHTRRKGIHKVGKILSGSAG